MRRAWIVGLIAVSVTAVGAPVEASAPPERATPKAPAIEQLQSGTAGGTVIFNLEGGESHSGRYQANGQLGHGTYYLKFARDPTTLCPKGAHGTARFVRSDGAVLSGTATLSATARCAIGAVPEAFVVNLTHGSRDLQSASFTLAGTMAGAYTSLGIAIGVESFILSGASFAHQRVGYWLLSTSGVVHAFGGAQPLGNAPPRASFSFTHLERTPFGNGYWLVDTGGEVFAFGDARTYGNAPPQQLFGAVVSSLSSTPSGHGYWLFTSRGRALPFGDAKFYGDMRNVALNGPVIGSVATPSGHGYYMVALDGGVFTFGDAKFRGSMGDAQLNEPVVGLVPTADNAGYWLVAADGGIFAFRAPFLGSMGRVPLARPVIGMVRYGNGYMMVAQDGGIFDFSHQPFFGSLGGSPFTEFTIAAAAIG
jgi:ribosomal protein L24E